MKCGICELNKSAIYFLSTGYNLIHSSHPKSYLGYLILFPEDHIGTIKDMPKYMSKHLGFCLSFLEQSLSKFFETFKDPLERLHFTYLDETPYIKLNRNEIEESQVSGHFHIHIMPRTKSMRPYADDLISNVDNFKPEYLNLQNREVLKKFLVSELLKYEDKVIREICDSGAPEIMVL